MHAPVPILAPANTRPRATLNNAGQGGLANYHHVATTAAPVQAAQVRADRAWSHGVRSAATQPTRNVAHPQQVPQLRQAQLQVQQQPHHNQEQLRLGQRQQQEYQQAQRAHQQVAQLQQEVVQLQRQHQQQQQQARTAHVELAPPAAPPICQHRVYLLHCAGCGNFLSDRGMRAVLLLRPNITLFSTDAAPSNSGATTNADVTAIPDAVERTCECLTQSLECFGCGNIIGYQIITPCLICSRSVTQYAKSANGHRYVFHYRAVAARERAYCEGEAGVLKPKLSALTCPDTSRTPSPQPFPVHAITHATDGLQGPTQRLRTITCRDTDVLVTNTTPPETPLPMVRHNAPMVTHSPSSDPRMGHLRPLQSGDTIYWNHLNMAGERVTPVDPVRSSGAVTGCDR